MKVVAARQTSDLVTDESAAIPPGCQQTAVSEIPDDWKTVRIDEHASITTGSRNTQDKEDDGEYPFFVRSQEVERINSYSYDGEAVLTAGDGRTGKVFHYVIGRFDVHQRVYRISDFSDEMIGRFFFYQFSAGFYERIMSMTAKSTVDSVRMDMIGGMEILLPPPAEQLAIAEALSDVDELLAALEKLIAKKRAIKQSAMQQLLAGQDLLLRSNRKEDWDVFELGELCTHIVDGTHFTPTYLPDGIPFYSVENVTANDFTNVKYISEDDHRILVRRCNPERGDILLTRIGSLGDTKLIDWDVNASIYVSLALLKLGNLADPEYVYQYTKCSQFLLDVESRSLVNATPKKINMRDIGSIPIPVPPTKHEQRAIGAVLSNMDKEITALEERWDKTRAIKQGMMQALLTGRVRLVKPEQASVQEARTVASYREGVEA